MRLLLTSDFYHPFIGGAERQMRLLAEELARRGHDVRVATTAMPGQPPVEVLGGVTVHRLDTLAARLPLGGGTPGRRFLPPLPDPQLVRGLRRLAADRPFDVLHAGGWMAYSSAAAILDRPSVPLVLSVRDYGYACARRTLLREGRALCPGPEPLACLHCAGRQYGAPRALVAVGGIRAGRPLLRRTVTGIHAVSTFVAATVRRDLLAGDDGWRPVLETIPDVVPSLLPAGADPAPALSAEDRALLDRLPREPYLLFVGALQRTKGLVVLLDAWARLADRPGGRPPLVCIGTRWPDTPSIPAEVTVLSDVPHAVVMAAWGRALLGVLPSVWPDPLPGTVREAMVCGRPVIATEVGGNTDMVMDGHNGLLVPPGDAAALAAAIRRLLDDPALAARLGATGAASVAGLTAPVVAARFEDLYARAMAAALGRRDQRGGHGTAGGPGPDVATPAPATPAPATPAPATRGTMPDALAALGSAPVRRIHVTGLPGSGKTTVAARLGVATGLPVRHLDDVARVGGGTGRVRTPAERDPLVAAILATDAWITEGVHVGWTDPLMARADLIVWLDATSGSAAAGRIVGRFAAGARSGFAGRTWRERLTATPGYLRHGADLAASLAATRRGAADAVTGQGDAAGSPRDGERIAVALAPHAARVIHARSDAQIEQLLGAMGRRGAPDA